MKLILPISFIIISILLFLTVINPSYSETTSLKDSIATYNLALDNSTNLQKTQDSLVEKYKNISQDDKNRLDHFLPNTINNIKFILEVEKIANLYNMQIRDIRFQQEKAVATDATVDTKKVGNTSSTASTSSTPYGVFPLEFSTDADYNTFILFLKELELNLRLIDVKSVGFSVSAPTAKSNNGSDSNIYSYSLKVQTYWLK